MAEPTKQLHKPQLFYRITALWVICEAFAGGIMHAAKIPFTGMIVSGLAICCIALLAWHVPGKGNILKATLIVAIFKLLLSPHSPPTAYIAVSFQGLMGQVFLQNKKYFVPASIFVAAISLAESAIQRLLVLWIVYGEGFWKAVNGFIQKTTGNKNPTNYSMMIAAGYVLIHIIVGAFIGWWISTTIRNIDTWKTGKEKLLFHPQEIQLTEKAKPKKKKRKLFFIIFSICLLLFYVLTIIEPEWAPLPGGKIVAIFLRSMVILLVWYFLLSPLLMSYIRKLLVKKQSENKEEIQATMLLLPEMRFVFQQAWSASKQEKGLKRISLFVKIVLLNASRSY